jgi:hypothetical protein
LACLAQQQQGTYLAKIVSSTITLEGMDPFGNVSQGSIMITAPEQRITHLEIWDSSWEHVDDRGMPGGRATLLVQGKPCIAHLDTERTGS